jgi:hypothetical protein
MAPTGPFERRADKNGALDGGSKRDEISGD